MNSLAGKSILVTGGSGSIGSTLVHELLCHEPDLIRILDNNEGRLYEMQNQFVNQDVKIETDLTNIRDPNEVQHATRGIDVVFHTAALKHVGLIEQNPLAGVETNILGTKHIIRAARKEGVESVVVVSTDKASNPVSSMGATKMLSERLTVAANRDPSGPNFSCVRFGNVLGTRGSVVPVFLSQLNEGSPLTVTDPSMTRFLMLPEEAADFVINAHERAKGGEVFVKKMPSFSLETLVEAVIEGFADRLSRGPNSVEIDYVGAKPGERFHEKLVSEDEVRFTVESDDLFVLLPNYESNDYYQAPQNSLEGEYTSEDARSLSVEDLIKMIEHIGIKEIIGY